MAMTGAFRVGWSLDRADRGAAGLVLHGLLAGLRWRRVQPRKGARAVMAGVALVVTAAE